MPVTRIAAEEVFRKALTVHPINVRLTTFENKDEFKRKLGFEIPAPAFFTSQSIYLILNIINKRDMLVFLVLHELGHQIWDPGDVFIGVTLDLITQKKLLSENKSIASSFGQIQNVYSDAVINSIIMADDRLNGTFGSSFVDTVKDIYAIGCPWNVYVSRLAQDPVAAFKKGLINACMGLQWLKQFDRPKYDAALVKINHSNDSDLRNFVATIQKLIDEQKLAQKDTQRYYDVCVPLEMTMNNMLNRGYGSGGVTHL